MHTHNTPYNPHTHTTLTPRVTRASLSIEARGKEGVVRSKNTREVVGRREEGTRITGGWAAVCVESEAEAEGGSWAAVSIERGVSGGKSRGREKRREGRGRGRRRVDFLMGFFFFKFFAERERRVGVCWF